MDTLDKSSRDYEICLCKKLNRGYVEDLIKEKNIKTLKELCEVGDIGNVCGGCREDLDMVLEEILRAIGQKVCVTNPSTSDNCSNDVARSIQLHHPT